MISALSMLLVKTIVLLKFTILNLILLDESGILLVDQFMETMARLPKEVDNLYDGGWTWVG